MRWRRLGVVFLLCGMGLAGCSDGPIPRSPGKYRPVDLVEWIWCGALTPISATVRAKLAFGVHAPTLRLSRWPDLRAAETLAPASLDRSTRVATFQLEGLKPDQVYFYAMESKGQLDLTRPGRLRTPKEPPFSFRFAFGACARTGSNAAVFDTIRNHGPLFFLHLGDLHYQDLWMSEPAPYRAVMDHVLASPAQSFLFRTVPIVYVWDDHDFGGEGSDSSHAGRDAVRQVYREYVPHYPLLSTGPIYQAFTIGRVRFVVTDVRSERTHTTGSGGGTILGQEQLTWLREEIRRKDPRVALLVWCNTVPWIAAESAEADHWGGFARERQELADLVTRHRPGGVLMLSADAHMLAIDDGSHSGYSGSGGRGFPVFQAASLDRPGSVKGGPYSHGALPGGGHFGLVEVEDTGTELRVVLSGRDWLDREHMSYRFTIRDGVASE